MAQLNSPVGDAGAVTNVRQEVPLRVPPTRLAWLLLLVLATFPTLAGDGVCGDGTLDTETEACDDGNNIDGDGCEADCHVVVYVATDGSDDTGDGSEGNPYLTIQNAFESSGNFTKILVRPGTYNDCIRASAPVALDRPTQLIAEDWLDNQDNTTTILTGEGVCDELQFTNNKAAVVRMASRKGRIEGFTITRGGASGVNVVGSIVITNNVIIDNGSTFGGGVNLYTGVRYFPGDTVAEISNNIISNNRAVFGVPPLGNPDNPEGGDGGGIFVLAVGREGEDFDSGDAVVLIDNNTIEANTVEETSDEPNVNIHGGGIGVFTNSSPAGVADVTVTNNVIRGNGVVQGSSGYSGGAWLYTYGYGSETIRFESNTVENNSAVRDGGGVSAWLTTFGVQDDLDPTTDDSNIQHTIDVLDNIVRNNVSTDNGGGLDIFMFSRDLKTTEFGRINARDNFVTGNVANDGSFGGGGGILVTATSWRSSTPDTRILIENNTIVGNRVGISGGGISLLHEADADPENDSRIPEPPPSAAISETIVRGNLIADNEALGEGSAGGGIFNVLQAFVDATARTTIDRNTVASNRSQTFAGGLHIEGYTNLDNPPTTNATGVVNITNSIFANNGGRGVGGPIPSVENGIWNDAIGSGQVQLFFAHNDVFGHPDGEFDSWFTNPTGSNGNISEDPLLDANWRPGACSPARDAADPTLDFAAEPSPNGSRADMGHTGGTSSATPGIADLSGDGTIDGIDVLRLSVSFGAVLGDARYNVEVDVDGNGIVDGDDLAVIAPQYGISCP